MRSPSLRVRRWGGDEVNYNRRQRSEMTETIGVLLMAYGGPDSLDDMPAFLLDIRGGRPTSQELIDEITENYRKIGGKSPLLDITRRQAALRRGEAQRGRAARCALQNLYRDAPLDALDQRHGRSDDRGRYSPRGRAGARPALFQHEHRQIFREAGRGAGRARPARSPITRITSYHDHPLYLEALARRVSNGLATMPPDTLVIFSAHSLPVAHSRAGRSLRSINCAKPRGSSRRKSGWRMINGRSPTRAPDAALNPGSARRSKHYWSNWPSRGTKICCRADRLCRRSRRNAVRH